MHRLSIRAALLAALIVAGLAAAVPTQAGPPGNHYLVTPLVSNNPDLAPTVDQNVQNAWGLARSAGSPWWISDNGTDKTSIYTGAGVAFPIAGQASKDVPGAPTGAVASGIANQFQVDTTATPGVLGPSNFIFAAEDGTISAWRGGSTAARVKIDKSSDHWAFKGLAISNGAPGPRLYAANFGNDPGVKVYDGGWNPVNTPGAFVDPKLPKDFAPFGIQTIGDRVFVTYAKQSNEGIDEVDKQGLGIVDAYDLNGLSLTRVAQHGQLDAPWGLAQAPAGFGRFGGDLLVGNFGDGQINAYEETSPGQFEHRGTLHAADGGKLKIDGLWALEFGNTGNNGDPQTLFFTAGPNDEQDGLFGTIKATS
jgi:uncharacterized protein (TIGR03118 family)